MFASNRPCVFVVDDERIIAQTLAVVLTHAGFTAEFFNDPSEALIAAYTQAPDLLLSDIMMPQLSGVDLAIQMIALHPLCKILLFSGQADTLDLLGDARKQGHDFSLLTKPIHPTDLLRRIREQVPASPAEGLSPQSPSLRRNALDAVASRK